MIFLRLFFEFFKTGLFAVGGGLATVPFLQNMGVATGWFTNADLTTMIAVSESTPGPMGVNMATYVGFHIGGQAGLGPVGSILGAVIATLGLITPSIIVILIIAGFLHKFRQSRTVNAVFQGLRPASTALIAVAGLSVARSVLLFHTVPGTQETQVIYLPAILIAIAVFICMQWKVTKKLHPIVFIGISALVGIVLQM